MTKFILSVFIVVILFIHIINGRYLDFDYKTGNIYKRGCSVSVWCSGGVCYGGCGVSSCLLQDPEFGLPGKSDAYAQNGPYDLTMKYAFDCYTIHKNFHHDYSVPIAHFETLKHCQQTLEKFTETINSVLLSETHYTLTEIYQNQSNDNMTIEHYEKSLLFQNYLIEKYDLSIYYYLEILNNKQFDHDNKQINMLHNCLVYCYLKLKQHDLAIKYANLALTISEKSLNITYLIRQKIYEIQ
ncbi:unnamed protein product [Rotaria sordida]|uniref:Uncharacterized protein n=1 Tax=Rotaria sordida TaxID=392033 RepID=A0A819N414_9BILA|nr:unnamed protein product [Rotaria sordida]